MRLVIRNTTGKTLDEVDAGIYVPVPGARLKVPGERRLQNPTTDVVMVQHVETEYLVRDVFYNFKQYPEADGKEIKGLSCICVTVDTVRTKVLSSKTLD